MRKQILLTLLLLPLSGMLYSQFSAGVSVGYDRNNLTTGSSYRSFVRHEAKSGFAIGLPVRYDFRDWFGIQSELTYMQKNNKTVRDHSYDGFTNESTNSYLQIPLMAHLSFGGEKLRGFVNLGGYGGYWLTSKNAGVGMNLFGNGPEMVYPYDEKYEFDSRRDNRLEFGLVGGGGMQYALNDKYTLFVEGRYYYSLTDMQKDYMIKRPIKYNNTFTLSVGCLFAVSKLFNNN